MISHSATAPMMAQPSGAVYPQSYRVPTLTVRAWCVALLVHIGMTTPTDGWASLPMSHRGTTRRGGSHDGTEASRYDSLCHHVLPLVIVVTRCDNTVLNITYDTCHLVTVYRVMMAPCCIACKPARYAMIHDTYGMSWISRLEHHCSILDVHCVRS